LIRNALSVDLEEYYHGMEFEAALGPDRSRHLPSRVEWSTGRVLDLLERNGVRATFFTVGSVAEAHPELLRRIAAAGHELACHGYAHELVSRQQPEEFRADVRRAKAIIEDLVGRAVLGYRAPNYSIGTAQSWAWAILLEEGFAYDSSVYPVRHDRYGDPLAPRFPHVILHRGERRLIEFPIGTLRLAGMNWPAGGGGYFRLLPAILFELALRHVNRREGKGVMFYFHPWELDPHQPRPSMPFLHRFRHYVNLGRHEGKLESLLGRVPFAPALEVLGLTAPGLTSASPAPSGLGCRAAAPRMATPQAPAG
jgi:polysaccharide deacetylase family protein (PEP-CTERM system associated)